MNNANSFDKARVIQGKKRLQFQSLLILFNYCYIIKSGKIKFFAIIIMFLRERYGNIFIS